MTTHEIIIQGKPAIAGAAEATIAGSLKEPDERICCPMPILPSPS